MKQYIAITVLGENTPGILSQLATVVTELGCTIETSRMNVLGSHCTMAILIAGKWDAIAKLESQLPNLEKNLTVKINWERTKQTNFEKQELLPYMVELTTADKPTVIQKFSNFFQDAGLDLYEVYSNMYTSHTNVSMASMIMRVYIPADYKLSELRDGFLSLCDELNVDAVIEPERS